MAADLESGSPANGSPAECSDTPVIRLWKSPSFDFLSEHVLARLDLAMCILLPAVFALFAVLNLTVGKKEDFAPSAQDWLVYAAYCSLSFSTFLAFALAARKALSLPRSFRACLVGGVCSVVIVDLVNAAFHWALGVDWIPAETAGRSGTRIAVVFARAVIEELAKLAAFWLLLRLVRLRLRLLRLHSGAAGSDAADSDQREMTLQAACVGFGFQVLENFEYFADFVSQAPATDAARGVQKQLHRSAMVRSLVCLHPSFTALAVRLAERLAERLAGRTRRKAAIAAGVAAATALHFAHNAALYFVAEPHTELVRWTADALAFLALGDEIPSNNSDVYFWGIAEPVFACFSNFYQSEFRGEDGRSYGCSEQYFMKKKQELFEPENAVLGARIMKAKNAREIKNLGRQVANFDETVWEQRRYGVMLQANLLKFRANPEIRRVLLGTGQKRIFEASPHDRIWGIGFAASSLPSDESLFGLNLLGKVLMEVRDALKLES